MTEPSFRAAVEQPARYRIRFAKAGPLRWIGHLDLQLCWARTFRRAQVPIVFTRGFHPHPRLVFAAPLPLGFTSEAELADVWLDRAEQEQAVLKRLCNAAPPGLEISQLTSVPLSAPSLAASVRSSDYRIVVPETQRVDLPCRVQQTLACQQLMRQRRGKSYDLRPLIEHLTVNEDNETLDAQLASREGATGRPDELLAAMAIDARDCRIHRTALLLG